MQFMYYIIFAWETECNEDVPDSVSCNLFQLLTDAGTMCQAHFDAH